MPEQLGIQTDLQRFGRLSSHVGHASVRGLDEGASLGHFRCLDPSARRLVLRILDHPVEADWDELAGRDDGKQLAEWMLTLPIFAGRE